MLTLARKKQEKMAAEATEAFFDPRKSLPIIVAEKIASYLTGLDLINLGRTSKSWYDISTNNRVWKVLVNKRFGNTLTGNENYKELYFHLGRTKMPVAECHYILHLNDHYLKKIDDPESTFGSVIYLNTGVKQFHFQNNILVLFNRTVIYSCSSLN